MSTALLDLRAELNAVRKKGGYGSASAAAELYALRRYSANEDERFFARTIPGPDGHVYWDGGKLFRRNDATYRSPKRWWYAHEHGPVEQYEDVTSTCGDAACINPEHHVKGRSPRRFRFTDTQMIGALQVAAMRLGYTPSEKDWTGLGGRPTKNVFVERFGSWPKAAAAAGLEPKGRPFFLANQKSAIASLRHARKLLGRWPGYEDFRSPKMNAALHQAQLPSSPYTINKYLGPWQEALRKAGKR